MTTNNQAANVTAALLKIVEDRSGILEMGSHLRSTPDQAEKVCLLEAYSIYQIEHNFVDFEVITDNPGLLHCPDFRIFNDLSWPDRKTATPVLCRLMGAYSDWSNWNLRQRQAIMKRIILQYAAKLFPKYLPLPKTDLNDLASITSFEQFLGFCRGVNSSLSEVCWINFIFNELELAITERCVNATIMHLTNIADKLSIMPTEVRTDNVSNINVRLQECLTEIVEIWISAAEINEATNDQLSQD